MRRALGKGLSQLIAEQYESAPSDVGIDDIVPNQRQPRSFFDESALEELASSIREFGVLQPLLVRPLTEDKYELIAGERRWRASRLAGLTRVPVIVRSAGGQTSLELALVENVQREDINALEQARAYRRLIDEFKLTQEQVAERVGKSRTAVANTTRLLRLPKRIQDGLEGGQISEGHARALLSLEDEAKMLALYDLIVERGMSVRDVERASKTKPTAVRGDAPPPTPIHSDPNDRALESALQVHFGTEVRLNREEKGGGKLTLDYYSDEDLDRILEIIGFRM